MTALASGRDVLAVMPTGYGKSAIYQVAALFIHGGFIHGGGSPAVRPRSPALTAQGAVPPSSFPR